MIDTSQANTMNSRFYTPHIIATGSSAIDQSSYSHHADNDIGVAVIDRWTYYNLDFLETQVTNPNSKLTLGNLFDSYDESKIHSQPGVRWDLFPGGEERGRERLVVDFFGNVQGVEVEDKAWGNESEWKEDLRRLAEIMKRRQEKENKTVGVGEGEQVMVNEQTLTGQRRDGAAKVEREQGWGQQMAGAGALIGCVLVWGGVSWFEVLR